jgi:hypothetical protein
MKAIINEEGLKVSDIPDELVWNVLKECRWIDKVVKEYPTRYAKGGRMNALPGRKEWLDAYAGTLKWRHRGFMGGEMDADTRAAILNKVWTKREALDDSKP